jgi:hypothetical protein
MRFNHISKALLALSLLFAGGCSTRVIDNTPAKVLESYIQISFNARSAEDKKKLQELLTGDTLTRLAAWSDEQFEKAFVETKKKFEGLKVLDNKKLGDNEVVLTYELAYQEGPADRTAEITQRKLCTVVLVDGNWKIKEVRSIRESIEYLKELSLP